MMLLIGVEYDIVNTLIDPALHIFSDDDNTSWIFHTV